MTDYLCPYCGAPTEELVVNDDDELQDPNYAHPIVWLTRWVAAGKAFCSHVHRTLFTRDAPGGGKWKASQERYGVVLDRVCVGCKEFYPVCGPKDVAMPHSICEVKR